MTIHDQFANSLLTEFLDPYGSTATNLEVRDEHRYVGLYFKPRPDPSELGLLGQMAQIPCLLKALMVGAKQRGRKRS